MGLDGERRVAGLAVGNSVKPFAAAPSQGLCCRGDALASLSELQVAIVASSLSVFAQILPQTQGEDRGRPE